jgi:hypothetical protein
MIVRTTASSLLLIAQPDHAVLARQIMERWQSGGLPAEPRRASILHAIEEHDNGWREVDAAPVLDVASGRVLDFVTIPADIRQTVWPRGVTRLAEDPLAAALVAQHAIHIYSRFSEDAAWTGFFGEMTRLRGEYAQRAGVSLEEVERLYPFVRAADLISLTFCTGWTEAQHAAGHEIRLRDEHTLTVHPDPFAGATVPFTVRARVLPNRPFASPVEVARLFEAATVVTLTATASAAGHKNT